MNGRRRRQQRGIIATALLTGLQEYQSARARSQADASASSQHPNPHHSNSFQEPMIEGVAYMAPHYAEPVDPNPPAYEEVVAREASQEHGQTTNLVDEKRQMYKLRTAEEIPPHEQLAYQPNTGLESIPRSIPAPPIESPHTPIYTPASTIYASSLHSASHDRSSSAPHDQDHQSEHPSEALTHLLAAISLYFDTQIKLHEGNNGKTRRLEAKKAQKLAKAERKYKDHLAKGKDSKYDHKMAKRADKMERWTEWVLRKAAEREAHGRRECCCHQRRARRHSE
ncbi:hypothetical protein TWF696_007476 [Orbilia brochopaga]|uniref:Uncharacterized protein n=1 Tax=Orbilia brochopaga TaxID=3140254 RepID=A0AAV9UKL7_9PEZI